MDQAKLRRALGSFMTGVTVVTCRDQNGTPLGYTANSFTSVSLNPPLVLVCLGHHANLYSAFEEADGFAVNILASDQREISNNFASKVDDRFEGVGWYGGYNDLPILDGVCTWFACDNYQKIVAGDHLVMIGEIKEFATNDQSGLGFFRGSYFAETIEQQALDALSGNLPIIASAFIEFEGKILMQKHDGEYLLPYSACFDNTQEAIEDLRTKLNAQGVGGDLGWLYGVEYEDSAQRQHLFFHVLASKVGISLKDGFTMVPMTEIQDARVNEIQKNLMHRFIEEHRRGRFGVNYGISRRLDQE